MTDSKSKVAEGEGSTEEQSTEGTAQSTDESGKTGEQGTNEGSGDDGDGSGDGGDELPSWVTDKMTKANAEAANYRTKLRQAEEKLKNAKDSEEVDKIVKDLQVDREKAERALLIENVSLKHKLPEALQKRLTGTSREELEKDAKELSELFGSGDEDEDDGPLEGGLSPRQRGGSDMGARDLANTYGHRRKR